MTLGTHPTQLFKKIQGPAYDRWAEVYLQIILPFVPTKDIRIGAGGFVNRVERIVWDATSEKFFLSLVSDDFRSWEPTPWIAKKRQARQDSLQVDFEERVQEYLDKGWKFVYGGDQRKGAKSA